MNWKTGAGLAMCLAATVSFAAGEAAGGVTWTAPKSWEAQPARQMRAATYKTPAAKGDSEGAELAVFYFGEGQGGAVDPNIQRWIGQFTQADGTPSSARAKQKKETVAGFVTSRVEVTGTYASGGMGMGPPTNKPDFELLGAIVEGPKGSVFFKLIGPKKTVEGARKDFQALLKSLKKE